VRAPNISRAWAGAFALALGVLSAPAQAAPIRFSTSGSFDLPAGPVDLVGRSDATADGPFVSIGTIPVDANPGALGDSPFQLKFAFDGLPEIRVSGTILSVGYNPDMPVQDVIVTTAATPDQFASYPELFQRLLANPGWMHTTSYRGTPADMEIGLSVHPYDPGASRPVPEPSTALFAAAAVAGLAWRRRRRGAVAA